MLSVKMPGKIRQRQNELEGKNPMNVWEALSVVDKIREKPKEERSEVEVAACCLAEKIIASKDIKRRASSYLK